MILSLAVLASNRGLQVVLKHMRRARPAFRRPRKKAFTDETAPGVRRRSDGGVDYYGGVQLGAQAIGRRAADPEVLNRVLETVDQLEADDYARYVRDFVGSGREAWGASWRFADILTALSAAAELIRPRDYLEIGVRRGRSLGIVAAAAPECSLTGLDWWDPGYAGMDNPGPQYVRDELARLGFTGLLELISGDSHVTLPQLIAARPSLAFDLVAVDGDHSPGGAAADLDAVLPLLRIGGALVFDDVRHPAHPELGAVWEDAVADPRYSTWRFDDVGYGVALAVRHW